MNISGFPIKVSFCFVFAAEVFLSKHNSNDTTNNNNDDDNDNNNDDDDDNNDDDNEGRNFQNRSSDSMIRCQRLNTENQPSLILSSFIQQPSFLNKKSFFIGASKSAQNNIFKKKYKK